MELFRRLLPCVALLVVGLSPLRAQVPDTLLPTISPPPTGVQADARLGRSVAVDGPFAVALIL